MGYVARTDTLELYVHECRQVLWTVSNRERVARRAACHLSVAGAQVLGQVKVVGAVGVVVLTVLLTVRVVPAPAPIRIEPELDAILVQPVRAAAEGLAEPVEDVATRSARGTGTWKASLLARRKIHRSRSESGASTSKPSGCEKGWSGQALPSVISWIVSSVTTLSVQ